MAHTPLVSVIIPTYNRESLVTEAIESVLQQSFDDFEVLVVDDGSTDQTESAVGALSDARLHYLKRPNGGAAAARNSAIEEARGSLLAFLDSDDLCLGERLALQVSVLAEGADAGLSYGLFYTAAGASGQRRRSGRCLRSPGLAELLLGPVFHWSTVMVRREWLDRVGGFRSDLAVGEEWELTMRLAMAGCKMICVAAPLSVVRMQPASLSRALYRQEASARTALRVTFAGPAFPQELQALQPAAFAVQSVRLAASAYLAGDPGRGRAYLAQAIADYPALAGGKIGLLAGRLIGYLTGLSLEDPEPTLRLVAAHLPGGPAVRKRLAGRIWHQYYLQSAFQADQLGEHENCRRFALQAIRTRPAAVLNRGLVAILVKSFRPARAVWAKRAAPGSHNG